MEYIREHKTGLIGAIAFHVMVLLLLLILGFFTPLPLPGEQGILVNFGNSESGLGVTEPSPVQVKPQPAAQEEQEKVVSVAPSPPAVKEKPQTGKEEVMTQDFEKTAALEAAKKKREEERQQQIEIERQKQAELERQRLEAIAKKKQEEENRKISEIDNRTKGAFGKTADGVGGTGSGAGQSQGVSFPGGNQGVPTGDPNAGNYGPGGSANGSSGTGISYSLGNRMATSTPKPNYPGREEGTVVVKITVDKQGNVTLAEPGQRGTTTLNPELNDAAKRAALQAKFNVDNDAPAFQTGTITYKFIIQSQ